MTTYSEWLNIQRGVPAARVTAIDPTHRYLWNGRDLAEYVHRDFTYQAYLHACLILLSMHAPLKADNPYACSLTQGGFVTFGLAARTRPRRAGDQCLVEGGLVT